MHCILNAFYTTLVGLEPTISYGFSGVPIESIQWRHLEGNYVLCVWLCLLSCSIAMYSAYQTYSKFSLIMSLDRPIYQLRAQCPTKIPRESNGEHHHGQHPMSNSPYNTLINSSLDFMGFCLWRFRQSALDRQHLRSGVRWQTFQGSMSYSLKVWLVMIRLPVSHHKS